MGAAVLLMPWSTAHLAGVLALDPSPDLPRSLDAVSTAGATAPKSRHIVARHIFDSAATGTPVAFDKSAIFVPERGDPRRHRAGQETETHGDVLVGRDRDVRPPRPGCNTEKPRSVPPSSKRSETEKTGPARALAIYEKLRCADHITVEIVQLCNLRRVVTYTIK